MAIADHTKAEQPTRYFGRLCTIHPELLGERRFNNRNCVGCLSMRQKEWRAKNAAKCRERLAALYAANKDSHLKNGASWRRNNLARAKAITKNSNIKRKRLIGGQKLSGYFSVEIRAVYAGCPPDKVVDHAIPLIAKREGVHVACGLHVPWNLQYLTQAENDSKGSNIDYERRP